MAAARLTVGSITIIPLSDGNVSRPAGDVFPSVSAEQWAEHREYLTSSGEVPLNFGAFLIHERDQWTLVDTGFGGRPESPGGKLLAELERADASPERVDRVIITHLHLDHIGWNTVDRDGQPAVLFKNARHVVQRADWEHFTQPEVKAANPSIGLCAEPLQAAGVLDLVMGDRDVSQAISLLHTPGHTPGHQSVLVSSGGEQAIILGDVSHNPAQIIHPDWSPGFDVDAELSVRTRGAVWERIEQQGLKVAAGHYPYPSLGSIVRVEGRRRWQPMS